MARSTLALALLLVFAAVAFGWRTLLQIRRHGDSGWRIAPGGGPVAVVAHLSFVAALVLALAAPVGAMITGEPHRPGGVAFLVDGAVGAGAGVIGALLVVTATALVVVAQVQMGASWRIGVDSDEVTDLITAGLFARVRNPIFTGILVGMVGLALLVPNGFALAAVATAVIGLQLQVRRVEEPYLRSVHGAAYDDWAERSDRFVPGFGRGVGR